MTGVYFIKGLKAKLAPARSEKENKKRALSFCQRLGLWFKSEVSPESITEKKTKRKKDAKQKGLAKLGTATVLQKYIAT